MYYQSQGKYEQAKSLYEEILKEQPHNEVIPKQLVGGSRHDIGLAALE